MAYAKLIPSCVLLVGLLAVAPLAQAQLGVQVSQGRIDIVADGNTVTSYVYLDPEIPRPYFAHLHAPGGVQVSRNHPPAENDKADHPTYHPGLWLAFGDLSGADNWRLKTAVAHVRMLQTPTTTGEQVDFAVENRYLSADDPASVICTEWCRYEVHATGDGYLLTWDSTFFSDHEFWFGDQEEMGLAFRVATPLRVETKGEGLPPATGTILDSQGRKNAAEVWGQFANWVDYSGQLDGAAAGITLFCHPSNFQPSRFHARDYGFLTANPFSTAAFKLGPPSKTVVKPGASLRLRYGVLLHAGKSLDANALDSNYKSYLDLTGK